MDSFELMPVQAVAPREKLSRNRATVQIDGQSAMPFIENPPLPKTYGDCLPKLAEREAGKCCQCFHCKYNLIAELGRMDMRDALRCAEARLRGDIKDSCALDVANRGSNDREVSLLLGTGINNLRREIAESFTTISFAIGEFAPWKHPESWCD